jgi:hypothetical protein
MFTSLKLAPVKVRTCSLLSPKKKTVISFPYRMYNIFKVMSSNANVKPILRTDFMFFNQIFFNLSCLSEHIVHLNISFLSQLRICVFTCITGYSVHEIMTSKQFSLN